jgi:hypothetical protein
MLEEDRDSEESVKEEELVTKPQQLNLRRV